MSILNLENSLKVLEGAGDLYIFLFYSILILNSMIVAVIENWDY